MAQQLDVPPTGPQPNWAALRDWLYKLWYILQGIMGDGTTVTFPGNVVVDGNLTVDGTTSLQSVTATSGHITGNLQVDGTINGLSTYSILLGVYAGLASE